MTSAATPTPTPIVEIIVPTETEPELPLSLRQQKALAITPKVFSFLSILGSMYIIVDVIRLPSNKRKIYHRILLGMSLSDCISSIAFFMSTWPIPSTIWPIYGASGTQQTCSAQGFFVQTTIATCLYSGFLAVYYYFVLLKGWSSYRIEQSQMEYKMHLIVIVIALGTSVAAVSMGLFNPNIWNCWIAAVPFGCDESWLPTNSADTNVTSCTRGDNAKLYRWVFFYLPLWIIIITVTIIMVLIVCKFQKQEQITRKWRSRVPTINSAGSAPDNSVPCGGGSSSTNTSPHRRQKRRGGTVHKSILQSRRNPVKEIGMQCMFYVGSFYLTWIFPSILRITELVDGNNSDSIHYHWVLLTATFIPCQGLFNLIVYLRPQFVQIKHKRQKEEELKRKKKKKQVLAGAATAAPTTISGTTTTAVIVEGGREKEGVDGVDNNIQKWTATTTTSTATDNDYNNGGPPSTAKDDVIATMTTTANSSINNKKDSVPEHQQQDQVPPPPEQQQTLFGQPAKSPTRSRKQLSLLGDDDTTFGPLPTADIISPPPPPPPAQHKLPILVEDEDAQMEPVPPPPEPLKREQSSFLSLDFLQQLPSIRPVMTKQGSRMLNLLQDIGEALQNGDGGTGGRTSLLDDVDELSLHERHARYSIEDDGDVGESGYNSSNEMLQPSTTTTTMMMPPNTTSMGHPDSSGDDDGAGRPSLTRNSHGHLRNTAEPSPPAVGSGQHSQSQQVVEDATTTTATTMADTGQLKHKPTPFRAASIGRMFSSRKVMGKSSISLPAVGEENVDEG